VRRLTSFLTRAESRPDVVLCSSEEVEAVVNHVELVGSLEHRCDVEAFGDLRVDARISDHPERLVACSFAAVTESAVANNVTS
jgi:hypothetical protein